MQGWLAAVAAVVALAWAGALGLVATTPHADSARTPAERLLPADGHVQRVSVGQGAGAPATVESARVRGIAALLPTPLPYFTPFVPPADATISGTEYWRETVDGPTGRTYAMYTLTPSGVHLVVALGGPADVVVERGLLALPSDVAAGRTWSTSARARVGGRTVPLTDQARAEPAADPARAAKGCLDIGHRLTLGDAPPSETSATWCPGTGIVAGTPPLGLPRRGWEAPWPAGRVVPSAAPAVAERPRVTPAPQSAGFGEAWVELGPRERPIVGTSAAYAGDRFAVADAATDTVIGYAVDDAGDAPRLRTTFWVQPGGRISALDAAGDLLVATTGAKRVVAYDRDGRRVWRQDLPDIAPGGVARLGPDAVVVATLSGRVSAYGLADGRLRWSTDTGSGTAKKPVVAGDRVLLETTQDGLLALDAATGEQAYANPDAAGTVAGAPDGSPVTLHVGGQVARFDRGTGELDAMGLVAVGRQSHRLLSGHGYVAAIGTDLTVVDPETLHEVGVVPEVLDVVATATGWLAVTRTEAVVLAPNGDVRGRVPLGGTVTEAALNPVADPRARPAGPGGVAAVVKRPGSGASEVLWIR